MLFVLVKRAKGDVEAVRAATRLTHLDFLNARRERIAFGGPILAEDGVSMAGAIFAVEAPSAEEALELMASDPYDLAGMFESVEALPWSWSFNPPVA